MRMLRKTLAPSEVAYQHVTGTLLVGELPADTAGNDSNTVQCPRHCPFSENWKFSQNVRTSENPSINTAIALATSYGERNRLNSAAVLRLDGAIAGTHYPNAIAEPSSSHTSFLVQGLQEVADNLRHWNLTTSSFALQTFPFYFVQPNSQRFFSSHGYALVLRCGNNHNITHKKFPGCYQHRWKWLCPSVKAKTQHEYCSNIVGALCTHDRCVDFPAWESGSDDAGHPSIGGGVDMESFLDRLKSLKHREHTYVRHLLPVSLRFQYDAESDTVLVFDELDKLLSHDDAKDVISELRNYMSQFSNKNIKLINERKESDRNLNLLDYKKPSRVLSGWIYLAQALGTSRYKIGKSKNPTSRLKDLREQSAHPVELVHQIQCPDMLLAERSLHQRFASHRVHGEWFELPQDAVDYICSLEVL